MSPVYGGKSERKKGLQWRVIEVPICAPVLASARPQGLRSRSRRPAGHRQPESAFPGRSQRPPSPQGARPGPLARAKMGRGRAKPSALGWSCGGRSGIASPPGPGRPVTGPRVVPGRRRALTVTHTHTHTHTRGSFCSGPGTLSQVVRKSWAPSNGSSTKLTPGGG